MVAEAAKKLKVSDKGKDVTSDNVDGDLVLSVEKLQEIQDNLDKINEEASDKVLEIEQKYSELRKPVYRKRNEIIKSIPDFWLTAFLSHPALGDLLSEEDEKIFRYLTSLEVEDFKDVKSGYSITFYFKSNPYFENDKITKSYTFLEEGTTRVDASLIKWKDGMVIPNGSLNEKKGNKRAASNESFFSWFSDYQSDDVIGDIHDEVAEIVKDDLWANPLTHFHVEADEESSGDDVDEDKDSESFDDDEDDDDEQEN